MTTIIPSGSSNLILGTNLGETITGTAVNDTIFGYDGNDSINGGTGNDYIDGGLGNDTILSGAGINQTLLGGDGDDSLNNSGSSGIDFLSGGPGNDFINIFATAVSNGDGGNDTLFGQNGVNDTLNGGTGNDSINGLSGTDIINGGTGADILLGGTDNDVFRYTNIADGSTFRFDFNSTASFNAAVAAGGFDTITDFTGLGAAVGDTIDFAIGFTPLVRTFVDSVFPTVQTGAISSSNFLPGLDRIFAYDNGVDTYLLYDQNTFNNGGNDTRILAVMTGVTGVTTLDTNDFTFS